MSLPVPPAGTRGSGLRGFAILLAFSALSTGTYRLTGGRFGGRTGGLLTTVGAKSGQERTVPLGVFPDGGSGWLVAASLAGAATHPAWLFNLAASPDRVWLELGRDRFRVLPDLLSGDERAAAWTTIVKAAPGYASYAQKTDREIPVVRLTRA